MNRRIAHCIHGLGLGGAQKVLETIATSLHGPGLEHLVYCSFDGPVRHSLEDAGVPVRVVPRSFPKIDPLLVSRLAKAFRSDNINLVHTHLFGDSLHGHLAAKTAGGIPTIMTLHSNQEFFSRLQRLGYRWLLPRCSGVVACSASVGTSFLRSQPALSDKLQVIPNGIRFDPQNAISPSGQQTLRTNLGLEVGSLVLLAVGRLVKEKDYGTLIRAFSMLPAPIRTGSQLLLLGQGPLEEELKELSRVLNLQEKIVFGGYRQDVHRVLPLADVVVFSSLSEGLPIALLEAMAAKKCIVATDIEGFRDALDDDREAILARPGNPGELEAAIQRVLTDPDLRSKLAIKARTRFLRDFTASKMVQSYEGLYRGLLQPSQPQIR